MSKIFTNPITFAILGIILISTIAVNAFSQESKPIPQVNTEPQLEDLKKAKEDKLKAAKISTLEAQKLELDIEIQSTKTGKVQASE